jgi:pimeloyl-ACP methyl ester carboxylesterase
LLVVCAGCSGCAHTAWVRVREAPSNPLAGPLKLLSPGGPEPTDRTQLLVRRYGLEDDLKSDPGELLSKLIEINKQDPSADKLYSIAELAYLAGHRAETTSKQRALELHGLAVVNAYNYLFDDRFGRYRDPYDPQFRGACDLYNSALESTLRIIQKQGKMAPGTTQTICAAHETVDAKIIFCCKNLRAEDFEEFHFVSDYDVQGLQNHYRSYGLGVPLVAVRKRHESSSAEEKFYPPGMSVPLTAFVRVMSPATATPGHHQVQIELYDSLNKSEINVDGRRVPLESDLTTPLAYALNQKELQDLDASTLGLLDPSKVQKLQGLYMLEPYQPGKIPVLMVHGLWSSPITWMEMFNDLRGAPEIRDRYQFWFYLYPTGQPFWFSAAQLRRDLAEARQILDPYRRQAALDKMVLVGHSMGGLVSHLQTIDSRNDFWSIISQQPFQEVKAPPETRANLAETFFFRPNPSVRRVITIGTPFRGSKAANSTTRWLGAKLITLPQMLVSGQQQLLKDNAEIFREPNLIEVKTSIDSLAPDSPILPVMLTASRPPAVRYHNIVGRIPETGFLGKVVGNSDGVVAYTSAHLDHADSEVEVNAAHSELHCHPLTVLEVRRILIEHLVETDMPPSRLMRLPQTVRHTPPLEPLEGSRILGSPSALRAYPMLPGYSDGNAVEAAGFAPPLP